MKDYFAKNKPVSFVFPTDGDCIGSADGKICGSSLIFTAVVEAPEGADVYVNGRKAEKKGNTFTAEIALDGYRTMLVAEDRAANACDSVTVFRLPAAEKKFRVSSDDAVKPY